MTHTFSVNCREQEVSAKVLAAIETFRAQYKAGEFFFLQDECWNQSLDLVKKATQKFSSFSQVVIFGTGGSSLGGQALKGMYEYLNTPDRQLIFVDDIDPVVFHKRMSSLDFEKTGFIFISKSGTTAETMSQALVWEQYASTLSNKGAHSIVLTHDKPSPLKRLCEKWGSTFIPHDERVGGRYSVLSVVGTLILSLLGGNIDDLHKGAQKEIDYIVNGKAENTQRGFELLWTAYQKDTSHQVFMTYCAGLESFGPWLRQLISESLGKDGKGTTPLLARGTIDQHSQIQLYLDGPQNKLFTFFTLDQFPPDNKKMSTDDGDILFLNNRRMQDLFQAEARATQETIINRGYYYRNIHIPEVSEYVLGSLFVYFMVETILLAGLLSVNPFDQPAVEEGKRLTKEFMLV